MRASFILIALFPLLAMGCADIVTGNPNEFGEIGTVPPQTDPEPRTVLLSEMTKSLGWQKVEAFGTYNHSIQSPNGDRITFTENDDMMTINNMYWRFERDAVAKPGNDLMLPESVFEFVAKRYNRPDLVRKNKARNGYDLDPLTPPAQAKGPEKATSASLKGWSICIDAGHGGKDPGGQANGISEKDITLAVSLRLQKLCEAAGAKVYMTRTDDSYPDLDSRCELANAKKCDLFISVHCNIAPNSDEVTGCEAYYNEESDSSRRLSAALVNSIVKSTGVADRGARKDTRGLRVLTKTRMPATLVELGYLSNSGEALKLNTKEVQEKMAKALLDGLVQFTSKERKAVVSK
ncbi:N-acetylmuramoyl-L-alanine amidase LytC [Gammaproteobacteria bacterium]|nr:N-acetylmuramoyl-L-alanine amidase LytC [Gammaproteobacteria bacterium]